MVVYDSKDYRIEEFSGLPKRFAVYRKERSGDRVCLVNIRWTDWRHEAIKAMNDDFESRHLQGE